MTDTETRMREILGDGWRAPVDPELRAHYAALREADPDQCWIAKPGPFWQIVGSYAGRDYSGADADGIALAERWRDMVKRPANPFLEKLAPVNQQANQAHNDELLTIVSRETSPKQSEAESAAIAETEKLFAGAEPEYAGEHETHGKTGVETTIYGEHSGLVPETKEFTPSTPENTMNTMANEADQAEFLADETHPVDADFSADLPALEGDDLNDNPLLEFGDETSAAAAESPPPTGQDRFIGLDDLDRRRSLRIGDTIRYAKTLMPLWSTDHQTALIELRNFAMGVAERRWDDDADRQQQLEELEAVARRVRQIEAARDAKVEFLEGASRTEVEAFQPEADWP